MKWGDFEVFRVSDGTFKLDGGAMFGVVPRVLWERKTTPDDRNRITLGLSCLAVRTGGANILIDTGCGFKYSEKELKIYGIRHETNLLDELKRAGLQPEEVDYVINTHLHFDHCGGNTRVEAGRTVPTFPNATYVVRRREWEDAHHPNERTQATYLSHNWDSIEEAGRLRIIEDDTDLVPGVRLMATPGHTMGHQSVLIRSQEKSLFFIADLCPTTAHVPLPWIMGYDLYPLTTLETRQRIYRRAVEEGWLIFFEHDPNTPAGYLREENGQYDVEPWEWERSNGF